MPPVVAAAPPRGPVRRSRRRLRRRVVVAATAGVAAVAAVGVLALQRTATRVPAASCTVTGGGLSYALTPEQAGNAATIAAVAVRAGLPDHAVTIALATALQESKLRNLPNGDRDSIGLFQQRPSQGWGTAAQVADPVYATTAFYRALTKLPTWQADSVAVAAQAVQRSADGRAYAQWEDEARALAVALTGERAATLACGGGTLSTPAATTTTTRTTVDGGLAAALGTGSGATGQPGLAAGAWLVAHAEQYGVTTVAVGGQTWSARTGRWTAGGPAALTYALAPPPRT